MKIKHDYLDNRERSYYRASDFDQPKKISFWPLIGIIVVIWVIASAFAAVFFFGF